MYISGSLQFAGPHIFFFFRRRAACGITTAPLLVVTERYFYFPAGWFRRWRVNSFLHLPSWRARSIMNEQPDAYSEVRLTLAQARDPDGKSWAPDGDPGIQLKHLGRGGYGMVSAFELVPSQAHKNNPRKVRTLFFESNMCHAISIVAGRVGCRYRSSLFERS